MITKSIRLTDAEASELRAFVERAGETEATVLKRAALDGLRARAVQDALNAYVMGRADTYEGAQIAGMGRAEFMRTLADRGISLLRDPSTVLEELEYLADLMGDERLRSASQQIADATSGERQST